MHSTPRRLSIFSNVCLRMLYLYIYIYIYYFVRGWRQFALIHRGCINACMRAHRDGASSHAVYCYTHNICVMAHVVTCRVWLYTQHLCNGACRYMPSVYGDTLNIPCIDGAKNIYFVYICIYIYLISCNGACRYMPCIDIHTTFV